MFVAGAIPGDRVRAVVHKRKRSYAHARTLEVLEPSPERIAPLADHPGRAVAGAPLRAPAARSSARRSTRRCAGSAGSTASSSRRSCPALEQWRYRNKLEYSFGDGDGAAGGELVCGFHAPAGGNEVAPIEDCLLASERGNLARELRAALVPRSRARRLGAQPRRARGARRAAARVSGRDERVGPAPDGRARLRNLVVREGRRTGKLQVRIVTHRRRARGGRARGGAQRGARREPRRACCGRARAASPRRPPAARPSSCGARPSCPSGSASSTCASPPRRSSRRTPRWPSCCTGSSASTRRWRAGSASTTSTRGSARSR